MAISDWFSPYVTRVEPQAPDFVGPPQQVREMSLAKLGALQSLAGLAGSLAEPPPLVDIGYGYRMRGAPNVGGKIASGLGQIASSFAQGQYGDQQRAQQEKAATDAAAAKAAELEADRAFRAQQAQAGMKHNEQLAREAQAASMARLERGAALDREQAGAAAFGNQLGLGARSLLNRWFPDPRNAPKPPADPALGMASRDINNDDGTISQAARTLLMYPTDPAARGAYMQAAGVADVAPSKKAEVDAEAARIAAFEAIKPQAFELVRAAQMSADPELQHFAAMLTQVPLGKLSMEQLAQLNERIQMIKARISSR